MLMATLYPYSAKFKRKGDRPDGVAETSQLTHFTNKPEFAFLRAIKMAESVLAHQREQC